MLRFATTALFTLFTFQLSQADTEFEDSIPTDTVRALFSSTFGEIALYSDIMDGFPEFQVPPEFSVVASVDNVMSLRAVFETQLPENEATELAISILTNDGWQILPSPVRQRNQTGFVSRAESTSSFSRLCHDQHGNMTIYFFKSSNKNYVKLDLSGRSFGRQRTCEMQISEMNRSFTMMQASAGQGVQQYMPRLEVPEQKRRAGFVPFFVGGGSSSSSNSAETETTIETELSLEELFDHFAVQMVDQGWELDTQNIGNVSVTGNWIRSPEPDIDLVSTLTILDSGDSFHDLKLTVMSPGGGRGGLGVFLNPR